MQEILFIKRRICWIWNGAREKWWTYLIRGIYNKVRDDKLLVYNKNSEKLLKSNDLYS